MITKRKRSLSLLLALLLTASLLTGCGGEKLSEELQPYAIPWTVDAAAQAKESGTMEFYFMASLGMDVSGGDPGEDRFKWGDSCLVVFPDGQTMLIDGGMSAYSPVLAENLRRLGVEKLDYVVISHRHNDHTGGLWDILKAFPVGKVLYNGVVNDNWSNPQRLEEALKKQKLTGQILSAGDSFTVGDVSVRLLWPDKSEVGNSYDTSTELNNLSLVMRFDWGEFSALFTGDLYKKGERDLLKVCADELDVDLVKIPHHGEDTSSSADFGEAVSAQIAVATGYMSMSHGGYYAYSKHGARVLMDYTDGYIHVSGYADGSVQWESSKERATDFYAGLDKAAGLS